MVNPSLFGRSLWIMIFEHMFKYKHDIEEIKEFLQAASDIIPCPTCKVNFKTDMRLNNIMSSNDVEYIFEFIIWSYNLHSKKKITNDILK